MAHFSAWTSTEGFMSSLPDYLFIHLDSVSSGPTNRVFAVCLGFVVVCLFFCLYLNISTVGNARNAGIVVRNAIRQQLIVIKVCIQSHSFVLFPPLIFSFVPGCCTHLYRIGDFPVRLRRGAGSMHSLAIPTRQ